jgi:hypothetical protein
VKCSKCHQPFSSDLDQRKRIEIREAEGGPAAFGIQMKAGTLEKAAGRLLRVLHNRCYWREENARVRAAEQAARDVLSAKRAERAADPGHEPRREQDWREQTVVEIGELTDGRDADDAERAAGVVRRAPQ